MGSSETRCTQIQYLGREALKLRSGADAPNHQIGRDEWHRILRMVAVPGENAIKGGKDGGSVKDR
jgi:hypothetical protein